MGDAAGQSHLSICIASAVTSPAAGDACGLHAGAIALADRLEARGMMLTRADGRGPEGDPVEQARRLVDVAAPKTIFAVLGTCAAVTVPIERLIAAGDGERPLSVLWLDAHADLTEDRTVLVERPWRGTLGSIVDREGGRRDRLPPGRLVLAGARDLAGDEAAFVLTSDVRLVEPRDLVVPAPVVAGLTAGAARRVHIHVDLDVLDPKAMPAVHRPTPGGPTSGELLEILDAVGRGFEVVGVSISGLELGGPDGAEDLQAGGESFERSLEIAGLIAETMAASSGSAATGDDR